MLIRTQLEIKLGIQKKSINKKIKPEYLSIHLFLAVPFFAGLEKMGNFEDI